MAAALGASVAGGVLIAFLLAQIRPTFDTRRALRQVTGLPVLGGVMLVQTVAQRVRRRVEVTSFVFAALLLVVAYGGVLVLHMAGLGLPEGMRAIAGRLL